jgi:predicted nucleic acid-binding protein
MTQSPRGLSLNVICLFEVRGGMEDVARIHEFDRRFAHLPVLECTREAAVRADDLWRSVRKAKRPIAIRDLCALGLDVAIIERDSRLPS